MRRAPGIEFLHEAAAAASQASPSIFFARVVVATTAAAADGAKSCPSPVILLNLRSGRLLVRIARRRRLPKTAFPHLAPPLSSSLLRTHKIVAFSDDPPTGSSPARNCWASLHGPFLQSSRHCGAHHITHPSHALLIRPQHEFAALDLARPASGGSVAGGGGSQTAAIGPQRHEPASTAAARCWSTEQQQYRHRIERQPSGCGLEANAQVAVAHACLGLAEAARL